MYIPSSGPGWTTDDFRRPADNVRERCNHGKKLVLRVSTLCTVNSPLHVPPVNEANVALVGVWSRRPSNLARVVVKHSILTCMISMGL
jgi:hypothetical protein